MQLCAVNPFNPTVNAYTGKKGAVQRPGASQYGEKRCTVCTQVFTPRGPNQKACSDDCARIQTRRRRQGWVEPVKTANQLIEERLGPNPMFIPPA
jgi:hypothetical protein